MILDELALTFVPDLGARGVAHLMEIYGDAEEVYVQSAVLVDPAIGESSLSKDFIIFTDRRNMVMAVNTADSPGSEIRMWYNPDQMENRQRAVFAIGCEILDEELVTAYINAD